MRRITKKALRGRKTNKTVKRKTVSLRRTVRGHRQPPMQIRVRQRLVNPFFALDIFICSLRKCIQHTTRGQSNFPLSKL